jgi:nicotinamide-nucleotide amidase
VTTRPRAVVVVTGSELVRGDRRDENGPFLASELVRLGADPVRVTIVGDRPEELEAAIAAALEADVCLLSGGLGPTHDDRTVELLARAAGRPLLVDPELEREIEAVSRRIAARLDRPYADFVHGVTKQASLPEGGRSLGLAGTAPGVLLEHDGCVAIALPGPPPELRRLWAAALEAPELQAVLRRARPRGHRVLRFFGPSESAVARALDEQGGEGDGVEVTVCARDFEVHVDVFVDGTKEASARGAAIEQELLARFRRELFAEDDRPLEELVLALARARGWTLATAESCTGGMVGARLTSVPGSSDVYVGGVVAYSNAVKSAQLGVSHDILERYGAVSAEAAAAMSAGARRALGADVAASVTGIAGPGGGTPDKPVGLVHLHVETPEGAEQVRVELPGDRASVRSRATALVLHLIRRALTHDGDPAR